MHARRLISLCLLLANCADDSSSPDDAPTEGDDIETAIKDASVRDARGPTTMRDAAKLDAGRTRTEQCAPGHYEGQFSCTIAGLLPWLGRMSFDLVESSMGAGEFQILSIAAGTKIVGDMDSMGGMFTGELAADFDCQTGELNGKLLDGKYLFLGVMEYHFEGPLQGTYRSDGGTPGFDGKLGTLTTPDFAIAGPLSPTGDCTWSADLTDAKPDAGK